MEIVHFNRQQLTSQINDRILDFKTDLIYVSDTSLNKEELHNLLSGLFDGNYYIEQLQMFVKVLDRFHYRGLSKKLAYLMLDLNKVLK